MSKFIIGLTGGIGSGKSTVANLFAELGIELIDADIIAREVVAPHSPALNEIVTHFGSVVLNQDSSLNRKALREKVFQDPVSRIWLENLLHPLIRKEIIRQSLSAQSPYCIAVIPLLKSREDYPILNRVLVVDAPESIQIARIQQRDQVDEAQAKAIIAAQMPRFDRLKLADDVMINDGHIAGLKREVERLHQQYLNLIK
ncbi:MAG: coaE [Gammaproteobacteria bacterium]|jgi:dephospho-CoA kinase|nr:coaE [Gammaproteobacteria bacterium]